MSTREGRAKGGFVAGGPGTARGSGATPARLGSAGESSARTAPPHSRSAAPPHASNGRISPSPVESTVVHQLGEQSLPRGELGGVVAAFSPRTLALAASAAASLAAPTTSGRNLSIMEKRVAALHSGVRVRAG